MRSVLPPVRFFIVVILLVSLVCCASIAEAGPRYVIVTLLHTNDMHGHVMPRDGSGGLVRIATVVKQIRCEMPNVLLLDAGDIIHGSSEDYLFGGKPIISAMNAVHYTAAVTGNHEYDFGLDTLRQVTCKAAFPFLAANVSSSSGGQWDSVAPYRIFEMDGVRVAVIGITTLDTISLHWPNSIKDIVVSDPFATAAELVPQMRKSADVVVVLSHLGEKLDEKLARDVSGIDFIIGGHSHTTIADWRWVGNTLITQTGAKAHALGRIDFIIRINGDSSGIVSVNGKNRTWNDLPRTPLGKVYPNLPLISIDAAIPEDADVRKVYLPYRKETDRRLAQVIGELKQPLEGMGAGCIESSAGDFVADAVKYTTGADIVLIATKSISNDGLSSGQLTVGSAYSLISGFTRQRIIIARILGEELLQALNNGFARNNAIDVAVSGATVSYSLANGAPVICSMSVGNSPIVPDREYTIAAQAFVMMSLMESAHNVIVVDEPKQTPREALVSFISSQVKVIPPISGRIVLSSN